jgi:hypothetical protein
MFVGYLEVKKKETISDEEKMAITKGIIDASLTIMEDITTNQTPNDLANVSW